MDGLRRPKIPERTADFSLHTRKGILVEFWVIDMSNLQQIELRYKYHNGIWNSDETSYARILNGQLQYSHNDTSEYGFSRWEKSREEEDTVGNEAVMKSFNNFVSIIDETLLGIN